VLASDAEEIYRFKVGVLKRVLAKRGFRRDVVIRGFRSDSNEYKFIYVPN